MSFTPVWQTLWIAGLATAGAVGCTQHLQLFERGPTGGVSPYAFWPPPPATAVWTGELGSESSDLTLGDAESRITGALRGAGYVAVRRYPVGMEI